MGWGKLIAHLTVGVLFCFLPQGVFAQSGVDGRSFGETSLPVYNSGISKPCDSIDFLNNWANVQVVGGVCEVDILTAYTKAGSCIGDASSDFCGTVNLTNKLVDMSTSSQVMLHEGSSLPAVSSPPCSAGEVFRLLGASSTQDKWCECIATPCGGTADTAPCGTSLSPTCTSNRCSSGNTSTRWQCYGAADPIFGDGSDGAFYFPLSSSGSACNNGTDCPSAFCSSCTGATASNGCTCVMTTNSQQTANGVNTGTGDGLPSVLRRFTRVFIGKKNVVTVNRTVSAGCANAAGSMLIFKVLGDFEIEGDGTNGGKIDMKGKGSCSGSSGTLVASASGGTGGTSLFAGGGGGAGSAGVNAGAGGQGSSGICGWGPGMPEFLNLIGTGGGKPAIGSTGNIPVALPGDYGPRLGATGGGSGGCDSGLGACSGTQTPGNGGGGVQIDVAGNFKIGSAGRIDVSGANATGSTAGGGGSGDIVTRFGGTYSAVDGSSSYVLSGGTGSSSCGVVVTTSGCAAGGNGGNGCESHVQIN